MQIVADQAKPTKQHYNVTLILKQKAFQCFSQFEILRGKKEMYIKGFENQQKINKGNSYEEETFKFFSITHELF